LLVSQRIQRKDPRLVDTSDVSFEEGTNQTRRRTTRRSAGVALASLVFILLTVSPSRGACDGPTLAFANMSDEQFLHVSAGDRVTIVGQFWTRDCFDTGGPDGSRSCMGSGDERPTDERPMTDIDVELARPVTPVAVLAEGLSAGGENLSWSLTFRVPELQPGTYRIYAHDGDAESYRKLFLRVSR
jgi:hypothetical protein